MRATLVVSDPWDLAEGGELPGTVMSLSNEVAVLRLDRPLQIAGIRFELAECRPRHVGVVFADDSVKRAVNVSFIPADDRSPDRVMPGALGTLQFGDGLHPVR